MDKKNRFPRLNEKGQEILDSKPVVVYMEINEETGEVIQEGRPRPPSLQETLQRAINRPTYDEYDWYDDEEDEDAIRNGDHGNFDMPEQEGRIPILSPHQEGFVDRYGMSEPEAIKALVKAGYKVEKPAEPSTEDPSPVAKKPAKGAPKQQAPEPSVESASGDGEE